MSNAVGFLLFAAVASVVGGSIVALRHRRPSTFTTSIDDFSQRMSALAPEDRGGAATRTLAEGAGAGAGSGTDDHVAEPDA